MYLCCFITVTTEPANVRYYKGTDLRHASVYQVTHWAAALLAIFWGAIVQMKYIVQYFCAIFSLTTSNGI